MKPTRTLGLATLLLLLPVFAHDALAKKATSVVVPPLDVTGTTPVGRHPEGVAIDPALRTAVVANRNDHTVSLVDVDSGDEVGRIRVGLYPYGVAVNPQTHRAVVASAATGTVSIVDLVTRTVVTTVRVGRRPLAVAVHPQQNRAYVANTDSNDVSVVDLVSGTVVATVPVGHQPSGIAVNPAAGENGIAAVTNRGDDSVTFLDLAATPTVHGVFTLAALPDKKWRHAPAGIDYDTSTNTLVVANRGSWTVGILRLDARNEVAGESFVPVGKRPVATAVVPGGNLALVTSDAHDVYAVDLTVPALVARATVGRDPSGIAVDGTACKGLVTNRVDNTVSLLGVRCQQDLRLLAIDPSTVTAGGSGFVMTLTGTGFAAGAVVNVGVAALTPSSITPTTIKVAVPASVIAAAGTLAVSVRVGDQTTNSLALTVTTTPFPTLAAITPSQGIADFTSFVMTLTGGNFLPGAQAEVAGRAVAETTVVSANQATVAIPADLMSAGGTFQVAIVNPGGARSNELPFLVLNPRPVLSLITPNNAAIGTEFVDITILGDDFVLTSIVYWCPRDTPNDIGIVEDVCTPIPGRPFLPNPAGQITATIPGELLVIPDGSTQYVYEVKVFNPEPGGGFSEVQPFTVTNPTLPPGYTVTGVQGARNPDGSSVGHPEAIAILRPKSQGGRTLAVASFADEVAIEVIDATNKASLGVRRDLPGGFFGLGDIDVDPVSGTVVVASGARDILYFIDVNPDDVANSPVTALQIGPGDGSVWPFGIAVNPTTNQAIVVNLGTQNLTVIDLGTRSIVKTITPSGKFRPSFMSLVAVDSGSNVAVVVDQGDFTRPGWVFLVDIAGGRVLDQVTVGASPVSVAVNPVTHVAVVPNQAGDATEGVSVIDLATGIATAIALQEEPRGVDIDRAANHARVAAQRSNQIYLIDLSQLQIVPGDTLQLGVGLAQAPSDLAWDAEGRTMITTSANTDNHIVVEQE